MQICVADQKNERVAIPIAAGIQEVKKLRLCRDLGLYFYLVKFLRPEKSEKSWQASVSGSLARAHCSRGGARIQKTRSAFGAGCVCVCNARLHTAAEARAGARNQYVYIPGPHIHSRHLEAEVPRARVGALALGAGADAVAVRLAVLPSAAVGAAVVEVEAAPVDALGGLDARGGGGLRRRRRRRLVLHRTQLGANSK